MLHIDFETRSRVDLLKEGVYNYATDPSTEAICMAYAFGNEEPNLWIEGEEFPAAVVEYIEGGGVIAAHNAAFERLIFWYVICPEHDVPEPALEQFYCTAAQCRVSAYPGSLEEAALAIFGGVK